MILYRYSKADGSYVYPRGKTEALRDCRKHAKQTLNDITLTVETVELKPLTGKTMLLALLNGEDVIAEDEEGDPKTTLIAEVRGKLKVGKPPKPKPLPSPVEEGAAPNAPRVKVTEFAQESDRDDQEYVRVYGKQGWRFVKIETLRPGMFVETNHPTLAGKELPTW